MAQDEQTQQLMDFFSDATLQELNKQFGNKGEAMHKLFTRQFEIHYNNYENLMPDQLAKRHGINSIFIMALDDVLCEVRASFNDLKETVISIYRNMLLDYLSAAVAKLEQSDSPSDAFVSWVRKGNDANYNNDYFQVREVEQESDCFGFDIQKCFYFDILREAGKAELGPIICEYDKIVVGLFDKWIGFSRHETLAAGDSACTFRYYRK